MREWPEIPDFLSDTQRLNPKLIEGAYTDEYENIFIVLTIDMFGKKNIRQRQRFQYQQGLLCPIMEFSGNRLTRFLKTAIGESFVYYHKIVYTRIPPDEFLLLPIGESQSRCYKCRPVGGNPLMLTADGGYRCTTCEAMESLI